MLRDEDILRLTRYAREVIAHALGAAEPEAPRGGVFDAPAATFVTLHHPDGTLQGCIGALRPREALALGVKHNALAAAFQDPRGQRLAPDDVRALEVEVSVLTPLERVDYDGSEEGARAALRPGVDGLVLTWDGHDGTFLPQVWDELHDPKRFLDQLKRKAGLPTHFWSDGVLLHRYTVRAATSHGALS